MKKYLLILIFLLGSFSVVFAQENQPGDEKKVKDIKALYVAYVSKQLEFTPEEAQKFWPVHTQFENDLKGVKTDLPELDRQQSILNIKKKYQENFTKILGANRCERFFRMNDEFKRKLRDRLQNQRNNPQRQRPVRRGQ